MSLEEWCSEKLGKLLDEDLRISTLNEIKDHLSTLPQNDVSQVVNFFQLPVVFDCLNDSNTEQVDLACEVLSLCMSHLSLGESTNRYSVPLERALNHPHPSVKLMALKEIQRNIVTDDLLSDFIKKTSLLNTVVKCVGNDQLAVANVAIKIISRVGGSDIGIKKLLSDDVRNVIRSTMELNEVVRLRFFDIFITIAKESESSQNALVSEGFMKHILNELESKDILLRMNIIEMLSQLAITRHGYKYLEAQDVMDKFMKQLKDNNDPLFIQICEPGILKYFGHLGHWRPNILVTMYFPVLKRIFSNICSEDLIIFGVSLDVLSYVSETHEGKMILDSIGDEFLKILTLIVERLATLPTDVRLKALNCVEGMLTGSTNDVYVADVTKSWFSAMGSNSIEWVLKYAKNPFSEIRSAGLRILNAISVYNWGQELIHNTPGLIEFLLDRNIETIKECKEIKFDIIQKLSNSSAFDHNMQLRLQAFVKEGAFYVQGVTEIAIEGND